MPPKPLLLVIAGPTASGKTGLAIALARHFNTDIINADSRQIYRELKIGAAPPAPEELAIAKHHFVAERNLNQAWTAGDFENEALQRLQNVFQKRNVAILSGGTGLYIQALLNGIDTQEACDPSLREEIAQWSLAYQLERLGALDPDALSMIDTANPRRVQRALELVISQNKPLRAIWQGEPKERPFDAVNFVLDPPSDWLRERINTRIDFMLAAGLEAEARALLPYRNHSSMQTVGYQEWFPFFDGNYDRNEAIQQIRHHTWQYARRQRTWLRNRLQGIIIEPLETEARLEIILRHLSDNHGI
jgi:tRNA dimethylallyltransferase